MNLAELGRRWEENLSRQTGTSLSRTIDPRVAANVAALGIALVAGITVTVVRVTDGWSILDAFGDAVLAGIAVFLTWALSREIDPDHQWGALLAESVAFALWFTAPTSGLFMFSLVIVGRLLGRTTGPPPRRNDLVIAVGVTGLASAQEGGAAAAVTVAVALAIGHVIGPDDHPWSLGTALAILVVGGTVAATTGSIESWPPIDGQTGWLILLFGVLSLPFLGLRHVEAKADYTGEPLDVRRIRAVRILVAIGAFGAVAIAGNAGLHSMTGAFAALAGVIAGKLES